jgi:hypothetical protein
MSAVIGLPLYFFDYTCDPGTQPEQQLCSVRDYFKTHNPDSTLGLDPISYAGEPAFLVTFIVLNQPTPPHGKI